MITLLHWTMCDLNSTLFTGSYLFKIILFNYEPMNIQVNLKQRLRRRSNAKSDFVPLQFWRKCLSWCFGYHSHKAYWNIYFQNKSIQLGERKVPNWNQNWRWLFHKRKFFNWWVNCFQHINQWTCWIWKGEEKIFQLDPIAITKATFLQGNSELTPYVFDTGPRREDSNQVSLSQQEFQAMLISLFLLGYIVAVFSCFILLKKKRKRVQQIQETPLSILSKLSVDGKYSADNRAQLEFMDNLFVDRGFAYVQQK